MLVAARSSLHRGHHWALGFGCAVAGRPGWVIRVRPSCGGGIGFDLFFRGGSAGSRGLGSFFRIRFIHWLRLATPRRSRKNVWSAAGLQSKSSMTERSAQMYPASGWASPGPQ